MTYRLPSVNAENAPGVVRWIKRDAWHIDSDCGRYRVNKALVCGEAVYQAVRIGNPPVILLGRGSLAEAKRACGEGE